MDMFKIYNLIIKCLISAIPDMFSLVFDMRENLLNKSSNQHKMLMLIANYILQFIINIAIVFYPYIFQQK